MRTVLTTVLLATTIMPGFIAQAAWSCEVASGLYNPSESCNEVFETDLSDVIGPGEINDNVTIDAFNNGEVLGTYSQIATTTTSDFVSVAHLKRSILLQLFKILG